VLVKCEGLGEKNVQTVPRLSL